MIPLAVELAVEHVAVEHVTVEHVAAEREDGKVSWQLRTGTSCSPSLHVPTASVVFPHCARYRSIHRHLHHHHPRVGSQVEVVL